MRAGDGKEQRNLYLSCYSPDFQSKSLEAHSEVNAVIEDLIHNHHEDPGTSVHCILYCNC